jgi:cytoskeleton protein RodZ
MAVQAADNRIFLDQFLNPGDTYRVPNMAGLKLSASDAGAIELILDDSTIGFAGEDGVRARNLALDPLSIAGRKRRG